MESAEVVQVGGKMGPVGVAIEEMELAPAVVRSELVRGHQRAREKIARIALAVDHLLGALVDCLRRDAPRVQVAGVRPVALLQRAGFALPVADVDRVVVRYPSPLALMADLRGMGATNPLVERRRVPLSRAILARMMEVYADRFRDPDGRIRASFDIIWLSG